MTDKSGAVIPKATVKITSPELGTLPRETTTDSTGGFRVEALPPGRYIVSASAPGFDDLSVQGVVVQASREVTVNASLEVSAVKHTVIVEASAGQELETESGEISGNISKAEVQELPYLSFNPVELVLTQPGVQDNSNNFGFSNGINFSVNGARPRSNNFLVDGQDNNDNGINGQAFQTTNIGEIQEVTVLTNAYSAEYGRGGGSVTNEITRRGSNDFHGEAWEINRNSAFAAVPADQGLHGVTKNPYDNENTFGFDFGGPIKHNKLFVYGTSQWDREHQAAPGSPLEIPTANGIATLQGLGSPNANLLIQALGGLVAPAADGAIALGPDANGVDRGSVEIGTIQRHATSVGLDRQWLVRLDLNATSNDVITGAYRRDDSSLTPDFFNNPFTLPQFDTQQGGAAQAFTGTWAHTFNAAVVNELRFSYSNIGFTFAPTGASLSGPLGALPNFSFAGTAGGLGFAQFGNVTGEPQGRAHKSYQLQDEVNYTLGRHSVKFGGDVDFIQVDDLVPFNNRGTLSFQDGGSFTDAAGNTHTFTDLANFVDNFTGANGAVAINFGTQEVQPFTTIFAPYVQDTWHVKSNLTLNLGLRYEYWGTPGNIAQFPSIDMNQFSFGLVNATFPGLASARQVGDKNNFGPRVGLAYTPHFWSRIFGQDKTVIRAGWGMFYDGLFTNILDNTIASSPNATGFTDIGAAKSRGVANATADLAAAVPVPSPFAAIQSMNSHLLNPLSHQWNLNIQREIPGRFVISAAYVGSRGEHLFANQDLNFFGPTGARLNPNFGPVSVRDNAGDSIYHSGQLKLERKFYHGFLLTAAYTYSKFIDDTSEVFITTGLSSFSQNLLCQGCDRGLSSYDRRHTGSIAYVWDLPYVHSSGGFAMDALSEVTRGWHWSGILRIQSGSPEDLHDGFDANGDGHSQDRPSIGNAALPLTTRGIAGEQVGGPPGTFFDLVNCILAANPAPGACNPMTANDFHFIIPASGVGAIGRNSFIGPGQIFYSTAIERTFRIPHLERHSVTFRTEFFNAFNHPNEFTDPPSFNPDIFNLLNTSSFLDFTQTRAGGRQIKFWLKYAF